MDFQERTQHITPLSLISSCPLTFRSAGACLRVVADHFDSSQAKQYIQFRVGNCLVFSKSEDI